MLRLVLLSTLLVASCYGGAIKNQLRHVYPSGRIVGGSAVQISDYPYQLSLEYGGSHICGASAYSTYYAVSAAHCVEGFNANSIRLRAGTSYRGSGGTLHNAARVTYHSNYDSSTTDYDVSVIEVQTPFSFGSNVQPISLVTSEPSSGQTAVVSGWGTTTEGGSVASQLRAVSIPIVSRTTCDSDYYLYGGITARMVCAGNEGHDSCQGDSGGPLAVGGRLAGIVSWGVGCARRGYPGVYTNVANSAITNFINSNTR